MDEATRAYFDQVKPRYPPGMLRFAVEFLRERSQPGQRLLDIGCGDGEKLALLEEGVPDLEVVGLDIAPAYLDLARARVGCEAIEGSILDEDFVAAQAGRFDYCVVAAVLHHLIGSTRSASRDLAAACLANSVRLLRPGGYLVVFEPAIRPELLMTAVFWIKKLVGRLVTGRLPLGPDWVNIGQPVVSYYSERQLKEMAAEVPDTNLEAWIPIARKRFGYLIDNARVGFILRRTSET